MRFRALDEAIEAKERQREIYDKKRSGALLTGTAQPIKVGSIVSIYKPSAVMKKTTFQWSEPVYIVVSKNSKTYKVRDLCNKKGAALSAIRRDGKLDDKVINRKMMLSLIHI